MSARGRGRKNHRTKRSLADKIDLPVHSLTDVEAQIESTRADKEKCLVYLANELKLALAKPGNDVKVLRLLKGVEERHAEALVLAARIRQAQATGLAGSSSRGPEDWDHLMATKRVSEERETA